MAPRTLPIAAWVGSGVTGGGGGHGVVNFASMKSKRSSTHSGLPVYGGATGGAAVVAIVVVVVVVVVAIVVVVVVVVVATVTSTTFETVTDANASDCACRLA